MLEEASARFRQWLTKIYRELSLLNVELNDGVQGMSDRMLATDTETEEASIQHGTVDLTIGGLDALGVSNPQQEVTRRGIQTARGIAAQRREYGRTRRLAGYRRKAAKEVDALPSSQAKAAMRKTPLNRDALTATAGGEAPRELMARVAGRAYVQQQAIASIAAETLAAMNMSDVMRPASFRANMRNVLCSERRAIASGDYTAAIEANTGIRI